MLTIHDGNDVNMGENDVSERNSMERAQGHLLSGITAALKVNRRFLRKISFFF